MASVGRGALIHREEMCAALSLKLLPGAGDRRIARLIAEAGGVLEALDLPQKRAAEIIGPKAAAARRDPQTARRAGEILESCESLGVGILPLGSTEYPSGLTALVDPPPVLFWRGDPTLLGCRSVAVVGSRRATGAGRRAAERISRELSEAGVIVVSGLALGIDGAAHRGALAARRGTVAVLGCGPDRTYPAGNRRLFLEILERGLLLSEFPPGDPPLSHHFPRRNRILAGLCKGVVVVEAARRSGALITVDHALDLGIEVFAVPGSVEATQSEGTNALIQDGAHLLTSGLEVLEVLGWDRDVASVDRVAEPASDGASEPRPRMRSDHTRQPPPSGSDAVRNAVRDAFESGPTLLDDLVARSGLAPARVLAELTRLELGGSVRRGGEGWTLAARVR